MLPQWTRRAPTVHRPSSVLPTGEHGPALEHSERWYGCRRSGLAPARRGGAGRKLSKRLVGLIRYVPRTARLPAPAGDGRVRELVRRVHVRRGQPCGRWHGWLRKPWKLGRRIRFRDATAPAAVRVNVDRSGVRMAGLMFGSGHRVPAGGGTYGSGDRSGGGGIGSGNSSGHPLRGQPEETGGDWCRLPERGRRLRLRELGTRGARWLLAFTSVEDTALGDGASALGAVGKVSGRLGWPRGRRRDSGPAAARAATRSARARERTGPRFRTEARACPRGNGGPAPPLPLVFHALRISGEMTGEGPPFPGFRERAPSRVTDDPSPLRPLHPFTPFTRSPVHPLTSARDEIVLGADAAAEGGDQRMVASTSSIDTTSLGPCMYRLGTETTEVATPRRCR